MLVTNEMHNSYNQFYSINTLQYDAQYTQRQTKARISLCKIFVSVFSDMSD